MPHRPASVAELSSALASAHATGSAVGEIDLSALDRLVEYTPEDMTVTVQAGATLSTLQRELGRNHQWLPIDPPHPEHLTLEALLSYDRGGPRRFGHGTIREHLIGLKVVLADGRVIKNGGKVVKNVAGYDLCKLFVGHRRTLGVIVEATFKIRPLPEREQFVCASCDSLATAEHLITALLGSPITPVVVDLHNVDVAAQRAPTLVVGFAGTAEEVEWQLREAVSLGVRQPASLDYESTFWNPQLPPPITMALLPSKLVSALDQISPKSFVARAGNGVIYHRDGQNMPKVDPPLKLMRRIKDLYDPKHILAELPW